MEQISVPVLIIGGGGCGLSSSIFLSEYGIKSLVVERHATSGRLPKARYLSQRTMEIFRQYGVADAIYAKSFPLENISQVRWSTTLGGDGPLDQREFYRIDSFGGGGLSQRYKSDGPSESTLYPQVRLEPLLSEQAQNRNPGGVLYSHELVSFEQSDEGIRAIIQDRTSNEQKLVKAQYLIAADGGRTIGPIVGSKLEGDRKLTDMVTVYFRADLSKWVDDDRTFTQWFVNPDGGSWGSGVLGKLGPTRFDRHSEEWMFHFTFRPDDPARFDESSLVPRMRDLMKIPDFTPDIIGIGHWEVEGVLADRYRFGRVFLAGDAAHRHPPTTGLGLNSAVHDAQNLAWKLHAVLTGKAPDTLLDTYESERRPVAYRNVRWALMTFGNHQMTDAGIGLVRGNAELSKANFAKFFADDEEGETRRARLREIIKVQRMEWQAHDLELGFHYARGAVVPDGTLPPARDPMGVIYTPTTRPGHRLPHAWIGDDGDVSTHDLGQKGFVLITGGAGEAWKNAARSVTAEFNIDIRSVSIGEGCDFADPNRQWQHHSEIGPGGAILVRPDNHVAWRAKSMRADPQAELGDAVAKIMSLDLSAVDRVEPQLRRANQ